MHQFDKVEMFTFCHPDVSGQEHDFLLEREEELVRALEIPYRVVNVCRGRSGGVCGQEIRHRSLVPGPGAVSRDHIDVHTTDFQARRLKIRFRDGGKNRLVHTLNGTAVAIGRFLIAIMENHQQPDGSIVVPDALRPYVGFEAIS